MSTMQHDSATRKAAAANGPLGEAADLQAIEGYPLTAEYIAMFKIFEHEGWSPERRRTHVLAGSRIAATSPWWNERPRLPLFS